MDALRFFSLFLLLIAGPALAQNSVGCPPFEPPRVALEPVMVKPSLDTSRTLGALISLASRNAPNFSGTRHEMPVGLTAASLSLTSSYKVRIRQIPGAPVYCAQISDFHLTYGFPDTTIYVAREVPRSSCGFKNVLEHEFKHVAVDRAFEESLSGPLTKAVEDLVRDIGVLATGDTEAVQNDISRTVNEKIERLGKDLAEVRKRQQLRIDTEDEYKRISEACDGELADLIRQYLP